MKEVAGYLPGCLSPEGVQWRTLSFGHHGQHLDVDVPDLNPAQITLLSAHLRDHARAYLKTLSVAKIVAIIDEAIARLLDRNHPLRRKAEMLLPIVTGYDAEMIRLGLTGYLKTFRQPQLKRFLAEDFNDSQLLDDFQIGRAHV